MNTLRRAGPGDAAVLAALHRQDEGRPWSEEEFATLLATPGIEGIVANGDEDGIAAFMLLRQVGPEAEIMALLVDAASRRKGLAAALMRQAIGWLAGKGVRSLFLEVAEDNAAALALYQRLGFADIGRRRAYYHRAGGNKVNARVLQLDLRGDEYKGGPGLLDAAAKHS